MVNAVSQMVISYEYHGHGTLSTLQCSCMVSFALIRDKYNHSQRWQLRANTVQSAGLLHELARVESTDDPIRLEGWVNGGWQRIWIYEVQPVSVSAGVFRGEVFTFDVADLERAVQPEGWGARVRLTDTPIALEKLTLAIGDPNREDRVIGEPRPPVEWEEPFGAFEFSRWYDSEDVSIGSVSGYLRTSYPSLRIAMNEPEDHQPRALLDEVERKLESTLRLLSLVGRRRVAPIEITIMGVWAERKESYSLRRFHQAGDYGVRWYMLDPLINPVMLQAAMSNGLLQRFESHPSRAKIDACIDLLMTSREQATMSFALGFITAFTAFETVVVAYNTSIGSAFTLEGRRSKKFEKGIREFVRQSADAFDLSVSDVEAICDKTRELTRVSFARQARRALADLGINVADLWPAGVDVHGELSKIATRRNALVHAGDEPPSRRSLADTARLNVLSERLIYAWIGGQSEWLARDAGFHHAWLTAADEH